VLSRLTVVGAVVTLLALLVNFKISSYLEEHALRTGFDSQNFVTLRVRLTPVQAADAQARERTLKSIRERVASQPWARGFCAASQLPIVDRPASVAFKTEDTPASGPHAAVRSAVSAGYFTEMKIALAAGRSFSGADDSSHPGVVIVDEPLAREVWRGQNPVGKRIRMAASTVPLEVVGVVLAVRQSVFESSRPQLYVPLLQVSFAELRLGVRTDESFEDVSKAAAALEGLVSVAEVGRMEQQIADGLVVPRRIKNANLGLLAAGILVTLVTMVMRRTRTLEKSGHTLPSTVACPNCGHGFQPARVTLTTQAMVARYGPNPTQCVKCGFVWSR
jgi:MacB-like periplasmic core domain